MASLPTFVRLQVIFAIITNFNCATSCYTSIFSFGDSLTDTGNQLISSGWQDLVGQPPYGETYFHRPTGRYSDGRIIIDFIAEAMGMPFVSPFLGRNGGEDLQHGVNFAVGGATALDNDVFREKGLTVTWTNYSLSVQLELFKQLLPSLCSSPSDCNILSKSLFLVGEIGGNDYGHAYDLGGTVDAMRPFVPGVINVISSVVNDLIKLGARTLVIPGQYPSGCIPIVLARSRSTKEEDYDPHTGCLKRFNEFAVFHNNMLLEELERIRSNYPYATIIYADYYSTALSFIRSSLSSGLRNVVLLACCGGGGPYNYNSSALCGTSDARACSDPSTHFSWDGTHLTEAAYKVIANGLLFGPFAVPSVATVCAPLKQGVSVDSGKQSS